MADLCTSVLVVLGIAWVVRRAMDGSPPRPLTAVRRRLWVFLSLLSSVAVHAVLAGLDLIAWRTAAIPLALLGLWLVLCRLMVRPRDAPGSPRRTARPVTQPAVIRRLSPAALALIGASILALWIAVNPMSEHRNEAAAASTATQPPSETTPASAVAQVEPVTPSVNPSTASTTNPGLGTAAVGTPPAASQPTRTTDVTSLPGATGSRRQVGRGVVMATKGAIVLVGDNARLTANTGPTTSSGTVALGVQGSKLNSGDSARGGSADSGTAARQQPAAARSSQRTIGHENATLAELAKGAKGAKGHRGTALSGFEDHSVSVLGDDQIVTYDDSNVFIDRKGEINANTGDTDSSGLNAVDVGASTVRAGNSGDSEGVEAAESPAEEVAEEAASPATSMDENRLSGARVAPPTAQDPDDAEENEGEEAGVGPAKGQAFGTVTDEGATTATGRDTFAVGADGYDDVSIRSHGRNDIVTYDDSNVTIGGEGKVNAQIGDSDTGGAVVMGIQGSDARAGCEGDLCYSANPAIKLAAQLLGPSGVKLTMKQWQQLVDYLDQEYASGETKRPGRR